MGRGCWWGRALLEWYVWWLSSEAAEAPTVWVHHELFTSPWSLVFQSCDACSYSHSFSCIPDDSLGSVPGVEVTPTPRGPAGG